MSSFWSRILVAVVGLPLVLGMVWLGGWWLFVLLVVVALIALHELYTMTRSLRPLVLAGYTGTFLALLGAQLGGIGWMLGGFMTTFALAFVLRGVETRIPTTVSIGTTVLGAGWIGLGLGYLILLRAIPVHAQLAALTVILAVFAGDTAAYATGRLLGRHKLAPLTLPKKTWEGFIGVTIGCIRVPFFAMYKEHFLSVPRSLVLGVVIAVAAPLGDLFE